MVNQGFGCLRSVILYWVQIDKGVTPSIGTRAINNVRIQFLKGKLSAVQIRYGSIVRIYVLRGQTSKSELQRRVLDRLAFVMGVGILLLLTA